MVIFLIDWITWALVPVAAYAGLTGWGTEWFFRLLDRVFFD